MDNNRLDNSIFTQSYLSLQPNNIISPILDEKETSISDNIYNDQRVNLNVNKGYILSEDIAEAIQQPSSFMPSKISNNNIPSLSGTTPTSVMNSIDYNLPEIIKRNDEIQKEINPNYQPSISTNVTSPFNLTNTFQENPAEDVESDIQKQLFLVEEELPEQDLIQDVVENSQDIDTFQENIDKIENINNTINNNDTFQRNTENIRQEMGNINESNINIQNIQRDQQEFSENLFSQASNLIDNNPVNEIENLNQFTKQQDIIQGNIEEISTNVGASNPVNIQSQQQLQTNQFNLENKPESLNNAQLFQEPSFEPTKGIDTDNITNETNVPEINQVITNNLFRQEVVENIQNITESYKQNLNNIIQDNKDIESSPEIFSNISEEFKGREETYPVDETIKQQTISPRNMNVFENTSNIQQPLSFTPLTPSPIEVLSGNQNIGDGIISGVIPNSEANIPEREIDTGDLNTIITSSGETISGIDANKILNDNIGQADNIDNIKEYIEQRISDNNSFITSTMVEQMNNIASDVSIDNLTKACKEL